MNQSYYGSADGSSRGASRATRWQGRFVTPLPQHDPALRRGLALSTVDDLAIWSDAVFSGKLVRKEWLDKAFTPYKLKNGESTDTDTAGSSPIRRPPLDRARRRDQRLHQLRDDLARGSRFRGHSDHSAIEGRDPEPRRSRSPGWPSASASRSGRPSRSRPRSSTRSPGLYERAQAGILLQPRSQKLFAQGREAQRTSSIRLRRRNSLKDNPARLAFTKDASGRSRPSASSPDRAGPAVPKTEKPSPLRGRLPPSTRRSTTSSPASMSSLRASRSRSSGAATSSFPGHRTARGRAFPESETRYFLKVVDAQVDFVKDASGA